MRPQAHILNTLVASVLSRDCDMETVRHSRCDYHFLRGERRGVSAIVRVHTSRPLCCAPRWGGAGEKIIHPNYQDRHRIALVALVQSGKLQHFQYIPISLLVLADLIVFRRDSRPLIRLSGTLRLLA
ncbi:hypothetical protein J6590_010248 [Homalodisca vitripennis]|nr:hypothetical protein J6590_010248 [Homalodisca vitripennis]